MKQNVSSLGQIHRAIVAWFLRHQRNLPWRRTRDPYAILVSEIMLQQTQVDRVIPKYMEWLREYPTVQHLAAATPRRVLLSWEGLGYNRRALYLHRAAKDIVSRFQGVVPTRMENLLTLPGVGRYTAAAVATFATGVSHPLADTNVRRVITRIFVGTCVPKKYAGDAGLLELVERTMLRRPLRGVPAGHWWHVLMDFGALVCRSRPRCGICPAQRYCRAYPRILEAGNGERAIRHGRKRRDIHAPISVPQAPSYPLPDRIYRGRIVQLVRERDPAPLPMEEIGPTILPGFAARDEAWLARILAGLVMDRLIAWHAEHTSVRLPLS